jgi:flagellar hook assembly protein FlgD
VLAAPTLKKKANPRHLIPNDVSLGYVNHSLQIVIDSDKKQKVAITVLDLHGNIVNNIYQGPWMPGHHIITWNGKNALGTLVMPGEYTVVVQANGQTTSGVIHFPDF